MSTCSVKNVYAPNSADLKGTKSILYADLRKAVKDDDTALHLWAMTRTREFKKAVGDWTDKDTFPADELDANGEILASTVLDMSSYPVNTEELERETNKKVEEFKKSIAHLTSLKSTVRDSLTRRIKELERSSKAHTIEIKQQLEELRDKLANLDWRETANDFVEQAIKTIENTSKAITEELGKSEPDYIKLRRLKSYLDTFDVLEKMKVEILGNPLVKESMSKSMTFLNSVIDAKQASQKEYSDHVKDRISTKLASLSVKLTKQEVEELLKFSEFDISNTEKMLHFMGDSKDPILALLAKTVNEAQQKTRRESVEFTHTLAGIMELLEAERSQYKNNPEKLYEPMLLKNAEGKLTGTFISEDSNPVEYALFKSAYEGTALWEFYNFFTEQYDNLNGYLPMSYQMGNRLPSIVKSKLERFMSSEDKKDELISYLSDKLSANNLSAGRGELTDDSQRAINKVPIKYTQSYNSGTYKRILKQLKAEGKKGDLEEIAAKLAKKEFASELSFDLAASLQSFQYMASNYNNMMEIIDVVEGTQSALYERKVAQTDAKGIPILNRIKDIEQKNILIDGSESNAYAMAQSYIAAQVYGQTEDSAGSVHVFGEEIDVAKVLGLIKSSTSTLMLGLNIRAGVSNIMFGETVQWAEAFGGEFYDKKNYARAIKEYGTSMGEMIHDTSQRIPKNKINVINEFYDILGDYFPGGVGAGETSNLKRAIKGSSIHFINSLGEHSMQSKAAMAYMMSVKTYDSSGKEVGNLWDAHTVDNGKMSVSKDIYIKQKDELVAFDKVQQDNMSRRIQTMLRRMHGNYNSQTAAAWQKNAYLQLIGQFRKWIVDGYARRWHKSKYNEFADTELEGIYQSFGKGMKAIYHDLQNEKTFIGAEWDKLSAHQKSNIKKTTFEISMIIALSGSLAMLKALASGMDEDDDKKKLAALRMGMFWSNRLQSELLFYSWPPSLFEIITNPAASMSVLESAGKFMYYSLPWNMDEVYKSGGHKEESKQWRSFLKLVPVVKQVEGFDPNTIRDQIQFYNIN